MAKHKKKKKKKNSENKYIGTHLEQHANMDHKDFPLWLRKAYESVGQKINQ